jgi:hypothetical protein
VAGRPYPTTTTLAIRDTDYGVDDPATRLSGVGDVPWNHEADGLLAVGVIS